MKKKILENSKIHKIVVLLGVEEWEDLTNHKLLL